MDRLLEYLPHLGTIASLGLGYYIKNKLDMQKIELNNAQTQEEIKNIKNDMLHLVECVESQKIKLVEINKAKEFESQVINELLSPVIDKLNYKLTEYVDLKMRLVIQEIEQIKAENQNFKGDLKEILKDFKDHTEKIIDKLSDKIDKNI